MKHQGLLLGGIAAAAVLVYTSMKRGKEATEYLTADVTGVKLGKVGLLQTEVVISLAVNNPSNESLKIDGFFGKITAQGKDIATFNVNLQNSGVVLKARGVTTLTVNTRVSTLTAITTLINAIKNKTVPGTAVKAMLQVGAVQVPVVYDVTGGGSAKTENTTVGGIGRRKARKSRPVLQETIEIE